MKDSKIPEEEARFFGEHFAEFIADAHKLGVMLVPLSSEGFAARKGPLPVTGLERLLPLDGRPCVAIYVAESGQDPLLMAWLAAAQRN